jgi:hypothetical protein
MQTKTIPDSARRIISLVQTDEEFYRESDAEASERNQILDGVVAYCQGSGNLIRSQLGQCDPLFRCLQVELFG